MPPTTRTLVAGPCNRAGVVLALVALLALATACADPGNDGGAADASRSDPGAAGGISRTGNDLSIDVDPGNGSEPVSWTLVCAGTAEGTHPNPEAACSHLAGVEDPFAPLPADVVCTEQYGGPQTAHVTGVWGGEPVDLELSAVDGCRISQWDALGPLLALP